MRRRAKKARIIDPFQKDSLDQKEPVVLVPMYVLLRTIDLVAFDVVPWFAWSHCRTDAARSLVGCLLHGKALAAGPEVVADAEVVLESETAGLADECMVLV